MNPIRKIKEFASAHKPSFLKSKSEISKPGSKSTGSADRKALTNKELLDCIASMKGLLNKPTADNAKKFNQLVKDNSLDLFRKMEGSKAIFREALPMKDNELREAVLSFEEAYRNGKLNDYDLNMASMFFEAIKDRLGEKSKNSPDQNYDILAIRMQKIITDIRTPKQENVTMKQLGSGAFNTVCEVEVNGKKMLFKPTEENRIKGMADPLTGGSRENERGVLTSRLNRRLGFGVVPHTEFANIKGQNGILIEKTEGFSQFVSYKDTYKVSGGLSKFIPGNKDKKAVDAILTNSKNYDNNRLKPTEEAKVKKYLGASEIKIESSSKGKPWENPQVVFTAIRHTPKDASDAAYRRQSVELFVVDYITGQNNREPGTIIGGKGIDNDNAWPSSESNLSDPKVGNTVLKDYKGVTFPRVVDEKMKNSIMGLKPEELRKDLAGFLTEKEINAAVERLGKLQKHLETGIKNGTVKLIQPAQWNGKIAEESLLQIETSGGKNMWTSYFVRDQHYHQVLQDQGMGKIDPKELSKK